MKKLIISGNLGQDSKFTANTESAKKSVLRFSVACRDWDTKTKTNTTDWVECVIFGERASKDQTLLVKGSHIVVSGKLQKPEIWTDKSGQARCNSKMIVDDWEFAGTKKDHEEAPPPAAVPVATDTDDVPF